jgi:hypothetical protein
MQQAPGTQHRFCLRSSSEQICNYKSRLPRADDEHVKEVFSPAPPRRGMDEKLIACLVSEKNIKFVPRCVNFYSSRTLAPLGLAACLCVALALFSLFFCRWHLSSAKKLLAVNCAIKSSLCLCSSPRILDETLLYSKGEPVECTKHCRSL